MYLVSLGGFFMAEIIAILRDMANWKVMTLFSSIPFMLAVISFISHLKTPEKKRSKGIIQPFSFMFLVATGSLIISILLFFLNK